MNDQVREVSVGYLVDAALEAVPEGYKRTEVGVIPEDWIVVSFREIFSIKSGYSFKGEYFSKAGPIVLTPGNFRLSGGLYFEERNTKRYSGSYPKSAEFENGDLLVVMTDLTPDCNLLGKPAFVESEDLVLHNQRIGKLQGIPESWSRKFIYYTMLSSGYLSHIKNSATGSTVRHTSNSSIYSALVAKPTIKEQTAIANALSDVDALINSLENLIAKKQAIKTATMQQLLTGRTRLPQFATHPDGRPKGTKQSELGEIPEDWEVQSVGESCDLLTGFPFPSSGYSNVGVRLLRGSNIKRGCTDWSEEITEYWPSLTANIRQFELRKGDIVISMDGSLVGRSFAQLSSNDLPAVLLQRVARLRSEVVNMNYLKEWVCSDFFTAHCDSVKTTTAIPHISPLDIRTYKFLLPRDFDEQRLIADALAEMDMELSGLRNRLEKARQIKKGMMQELLTGRTRLV